MTISTTNEAPAPRGPEPPRDCPLCPRLVAYRAANRAAHPSWWNGPAPSFGAQDARLLVLGLAPGLRGANRTGRPFTGDAAGDVLYPALKAAGFARGSYGTDPADGFELIDAMVSNAVRCAPPANKPTPLEAATCRPFLRARLDGLRRLRCVVALGRIAHDALLSAYGLVRARRAFAHGAEHEIATPAGTALTLIDSYHCSRYNMNTGRLSVAMVEAIFVRARHVLDAR